MRSNKCNMELNACGTLTPSNATITVTLRLAGDKQTQIP